MKIAVIADALDNQYAGIREYTLQLLLGMAALDHTHEVIAVRGQTGGLPSRIREIALPFLSMPMAQIYRLGWQVPRILRKEGVDVVIEPRHVGPFNLPAAIKRVTVIHDISWYKYPHFHPFVSAQLQKRIVPRVLRRADLVVTNSHFTTAEVVEQFPFCAHKIQTAHLGRPVDFKRSVHRSVRDRFGIPDPYVLFVSTLEPRKNLVHLLEAYATFRRTIDQPVPLVLAGKAGWRTQAFARAWREHPYQKDIVHLGYVSREELMQLYSEATLLVYPSLYEGFGIPVLEAFACETPVITSNYSSLPEITEEAALLIDPNDPADTARAMTDLFRDPALRQKLIRQGQERLQDFSWTHTARTILQAIEQL